MHRASLSYQPILNTTTRVVLKAILSLGRFFSYSKTASNFHFPRYRLQTKSTRGSYRDLSKQ